MFHYQGLSYAEIAAVLEIPVGTVRSRLAKGRKLLELELEALGYPLNEADSVG
jgi:RNA polymerase sigma-70 factor (ECF subfamily)